MLTPQFDAISLVINRSQKEVFNVLPPASKRLPLNIGKCKQSECSLFFRL